MGFLCLKAHSPSPPSSVDEQVEGRAAGGRPKAGEEPCRSCRRWRRRGGRSSSTASARLSGGVPSPTTPRSSMAAASPPPTSRPASSARPSSPPSARARTCGCSSIRRPSLPSSSVRKYASFTLLHGTFAQSCHFFFLSVMYGLVNIEFLVEMMSVVLLWLQLWCCFEVFA